MSETEEAHDPPILTESDIKELIWACYELDAEHPRGWEPCRPLVKKLEAMLASAPESAPSHMIGTKEMNVFTAEESWGMSEPDKVIALIKTIECWRLGDWDGCVCSSFSIRNVNVDISCGKGREQGVWVSSASGTYYGDEDALRRICTEVVRQVSEQSGRGGTFAQYVNVT